MSEPAMRCFQRSLERLYHLVEQIAEVDANAQLLFARLSPGMLPLVNQIKTAANFPLRACCPLVGRDRVNFDSEGEDYTSLLSQISLTQDYLESLAPFDLERAGTVSDSAGFTDIELPAREYLYQYALPNFYFHLSMVYAIARVNGVPLSKGDFDGYHEYPPGFSFER